MIEIQNKKDCCGCHACITICPKQCIAMREDEEGFLYPHVDKGVCIDCGLCEKVCPVINQSEPSKPLKVYAAKNKNEEVRLQSSSGGIFTLLAEKTIQKGGVVFGAKFNEHWEIVHDWTDTIEGIAAFRGSKYVQSTIGNTYSEVQTFLKTGRKVLFSGTPCQIAGLKKYLRNEYDNLLMVDIACHGVPSPLVWRTFLKEINCNSECIKAITFRDKSKGWKAYRMEIKGMTSDLYSDCTNKNIYMCGFLKNLYLRPSCHCCPSKSGKSGSDITIADFWGVQNYYPEFDDDKGVSLIFVNTQRGADIYDSVNVVNQEATYEQGLNGNPCIAYSVAIPKYKNFFWKLFPKQGIASIEHVVKKMQPSLIKRLYKKCRIVVSKILK